MNVPLKVWAPRSVSREQAAEMASRLGVSTTVATVLLGRGLVQDDQEARAFLKPDIQSLPNPFLMKDMGRAVDLARQAIQEHWPILVHGDRDVDGVSATSLLSRLLKDLGADVSTHVPGEVYGIATETIEAAAQRGVRLLITADCGTTAHQPIARARELGVEVIVLDHHQPEGELPAASALINPNRPDCDYQFKLLAGSGISFKFAWALYLSYEPAFEDEIVVVDLETTGLEAERCEIVEVAAIRFRRGLEQETFHSLVRPPTPIPPEALAIHGIDDAQVADSPVLEDVLPKLLYFLGPRTVVAHNAAFDAGFLDHACRKVLGSGFASPTWCTRNQAKAVLPQLASHRLSALCQHFEIESPRFHRAIDDARATGQLYYQLLRLASRQRRSEFYRRYLSDLTLGTLADVVPVLGENRVLCHFGLKNLATDQRPGIRALCEEAAPGATRYCARDVTFGIAPLLNAAGRAGQADLSLRLLCTDSKEEARALVAQLRDMREQGRNRTHTMTADLREMLHQQADVEHDRVLVVVTSQHQHGVTGVVANRLMDEFGRPLVVLIDDGTEIRGSARAPEPVNILELLRLSSQEVERFGGHRQAVGLSVAREKIESFRKAINQAAEELYGDQPMAAVLSVDADLELQEIDEALHQELSLLEPFGAGNPAPVFRLEGVVPSEARRIGKDERHLRLNLGLARGGLQAVGWNFGDRGFDEVPGKALDLVFQLESNEFQGRRSLRLNLLDLRPALRPESV